MHHALGCTVGQGLTGFSTLALGSILAFLAIFAAVGLSGAEATLGRAALLVLGVWVGSLLWWLVLSFGIGSCLRSFEPRHLAWINRGSGAILFLSGAVLLADLLTKHMG